MKRLVGPVHPHLATFPFIFLISVLFEIIRSNFQAMNIQKAGYVLQLLSDSSIEAALDFAPDSLGRISQAWQAANVTVSQ
jgi:hypothetical protein